MIRCFFALIKRDPVILVPELALSLLLGMGLNFVPKPLNTDWVEQFWLEVLVIGILMLVGQLFSYTVFWSGMTGKLSLKESLTKTLSSLPFLISFIGLSLAGGIVIYLIAELLKLPFIMGVIGIIGFTWTKMVMAYYVKYQGESKKAFKKATLFLKQFRLVILLSLYILSLFMISGLLSTMVMSIPIVGPSILVPLVSALSGGLIVYISLRYTIDSVIVDTNV